MEAPGGPTARRVPSVEVHCPSLHAIVLGMTRWGAAAIAYLLLAVVAEWVAESFLGRTAVLFSNPWLPMDDALEVHAYSGLLGLCVGVIVVLGTKALVLRAGFAAKLHSELRPLAIELSGQMVVVLATTSAVGEELLFRGLLLPWIGLFPQAVLFGLLHQTGGASRWVWIAWATLMGLTFGAMYQLTGSMVGPVVAHGIVNGLNLRFLQRHDPSRERKPLGGLLGQRS